MWDLTVPGNNDHDFYVEPSSESVESTTGNATAVLVHNYNCSELSNIADEVHAVLSDDRRALDNRTVGIMETTDGQLLAANAGDSFTIAQKGVLSQYGIRAIPFRGGVHAEVQLLDYLAASKNTLFPLAAKALGVSRSFCPEICQPAIIASKGIIQDGLKGATW